VFVRVCDQHIMGPNGPVALAQTAVSDIMTDLRVVEINRLAVRDRVRAAYNAVAEESRRCRS